MSVSIPAPAICFGQHGMRLGRCAAVTGVKGGNLADISEDGAGEWFPLSTPSPVLHYLHFRGVPLFLGTFFVDTSTITTIDTGLKNIAVMKHFGNSQQDGLLWLTSNIEEWLLVFDNADDPSINLHDFIPECDHGNIIITTRNPGLCGYGSDFLVSDMQEEDAVALLLKTAGQKATAKTEQLATEIIKALYYLPLAIVQAGAFILKSRNLGSYLDLYRRNQAQLLSEKPAQSHDSYAWTVYTTWQMSFDRLSPPAAMLLQLCLFLHHNLVSEEIFHYASKYTVDCDDPCEDDLQEPSEFLSHFLGPNGKWDSLKFTLVMSDIQAYSLISLNEETKLFSIHPLVHAWGRATIHNPDKHMLAMSNILGMALSQRSEWDSVLPSLILCPHVELAVQNSTDLALLFRYYYGIFFLEAGKYRQAVRMLEAVLEKYKQVLGEDHPETIHAMGNLGGTYNRLGDYQKAKDLEVIVLEKHKQILGEDHPDTICAMGNLGSTYNRLGKYQNAKDLEVIVLEKRKQILGEDHPNTLLTMGNLGNTYHQLGGYQNAKDLEVVVLEKRKQILGEDHPETIRAMGNLGSTYRELRDYQNAKDLQAIVLEKRKQILGEDHPDTIRAMGNLGSINRELGDYQNAKDLEVVVLEKRKQILGEDHPDTLRAMGNLGGTYRELGDYQNTKDLQVIVLEKCTQILGEDHPDTIRAMANLATTHWHLEEYGKAEKLEVIVLQKRKQILGDTHPATLRARRNLAHTYSDMREHEKAQELEESVQEPQSPSE
ncbi:hypothetical protein C8R45DRAFT_1081237 [Mycena sanguinolenta]|nr:hypothetical protein C8R45DRAFT_1081237 [Mycena sanguinolenta]